MSPSSPLSVEHLTFRYRSRTEAAIHDLSFEVEPGQVILIAGSSGCGKTTLMRCINGLVPRSYRGELNGRILIDGQDIQDLSLARISQLVGTVLQDPERQILGTRVISEVAFGLENLRLSRAEIRERVDEALARLNITHLRDRETFHLSGGEKQKVALAGVLVMRPRLLVLDEPLASLDPASAVEALNMVRTLADEGMTILMVEHRVEDVLKIQPERLMYMKDGRFDYDGPPGKLTTAVNYHEVKLPAKMVLQRAAQAPLPEPLNPLPSFTGQPSEPLVQFENVSFGYEPERTVLHDVNLTIRRGDVIAVLGPNGAGKTTLVKHAIGLLKPTAGHVLVNGKDTHDLSVAQIANTLGYVFQSPSHMLFAPTVNEELAFGPTNLRHPPQQIEQDVREAINIVNLDGFQEYSPMALSFGQQKRVSIAAILAMHSRILVMDEPTAGQDFKNYTEFMESILRLPGFESILFITHDIDIAVSYANRVLVVNNGTLAADGTPEEVLRDFDWLRANRLVPTSLLEVNLELLGKTGRFMRAEELAHSSALNESRFIL